MTFTDMIYHISFCDTLPFALTARFTAATVQQNYSDQNNVVARNRFFYLVRFLKKNSDSVQNEFHSVRKCGSVQIF